MGHGYAKKIFNIIKGADYIAHGYRRRLIRKYIDYAKKRKASGNE